MGVDITTKFVSANPGTETVVVQTDTPTLEIVDTVHFSGATMYVSMAMTNKNFTAGSEPISAQIPIFLGSLALGNLLENGTTSQASPGVWVLNSGAGTAFDICQHRMCCRFVQTSLVRMSVNATVLTFCESCVNMQEVGTKVLTRVTATIQLSLMGASVRPESATQTTTLLALSLS
jgi:hypothetical protein